MKQLNLISHIATGNQDITTRIWDIRKTDKELKILQGELGAQNNVQFSPNGLYLACADSLDFVQIYDIDNDYESYQLIDFFGDITGMDFSKNGQKFFIGVNFMQYDGIFEYEIYKKKSLYDIKYMDID